MDKQKILERVIHIIKEQGFDIAPEQEVESTHIHFDLGMDSIDAIELMMEVEKYFFFNLNDEVFESLKTLGDYSDVIHEYMPRSYRNTIQ
jgi:acyl carrier protein